MDFFEAMQLMKQGHKVRLKSWDDKTYIGIKEEEVKVFGKTKIKYTAINSMESDLSPTVSFSALLAADWNVIQED